MAFKAKDLMISGLAPEDGPYGNTTGCCGGSQLFVEAGKHPHHGCGRSLLWCGKTLPEAVDLHLPARSAKALDDLKKQLIQQLARVEKQKVLTEGKPPRKAKP